MRAQGSRDRQEDRRGDRQGQLPRADSFVPGEGGTQISWPAPSPSGGRTREVTVMPTIHPSAVLPADDRDAAYAGLVSDLRAAAAALGGH